MTDAATAYDEICDRFGEVFSEFLEVHGLTNTGVAEKIGRDHSFVSRLRNGQRLPTITTLTAICSQLKVSPIDRDALVLATMGGPYDDGLKTYLRKRWDARSKKDADQQREGAVRSDL